MEWLCDCILLIDCVMKKNLNAQFWRINTQKKTKQKKNHIVKLPFFTFLCAHLFIDY